MEALLTAHVLKIVIGVVVGGVLGYLYYRVIGCATGACPLTSNKYSATIYGAILGLFFTLN